MLERLGEFAIKKQLGEGGMGAVYLAYQESLDRDVALKVLTERLCRNEKFIARFKREARSAASIIHPNVIQIYCIGEENGIHYFAMEAVKGRDLSGIMESGRRFTVEETVDIVMQVAEACACAGEAGIIHRDLKPANIMLTERGLVKVTDFGLAKTVSSDLDVTEAGTIVGTANYMSPEQGQGKLLDARSDIYSLGVVFFELLTGRVPFVAGQPSAVLYMHVYEPAPAPSKFNPQVPAAVDRMVLRMMAKNPDDRSKDADALLAELRGLRQSLGTPAPAPAGGDSVAISAPATLAAAPAPLPAAAAASSDSSAISKLPPGSLKALVADDVASVRKLYANVLSGLNFGILEAGDGEAAIEIWKRDNPALIILDLNMPKKSGLQILQEKVALGLGGEVIVISARKERETVREVAASGVCTYLTKPVNVHELRSRIEKVMDAPDGRAAVSRVAGAEQAAPSGKQIVIYDAGAYAKSMYRGILESLGHQVACVDKPASLLRILGEGQPDLLVASLGRQDAGATEVLNAVAARGGALPLIAIADEYDQETLNRIAGANLGQALEKPVKLGDFRLAVEQALAKGGKRSAPPMQGPQFTQVIKEQLSHDHEYTVFDFAKELAGVLPQGARVSFENRLADGSPREIQSAVTNLLRKLRADNRLDIGLRYLKHAYMHGNLEVRNLCLALLPELLDRKGEVEMLLKVITDEDFRIRCQVLERLSELRAEEGADLIVRFLNDDVWKVRKAAASCLEEFDLAKVIEPLILFYSRSQEPFPDRIRRRLLGGTGAKELGLLEKLSKHQSGEVRAFTAGFLGELKSKLSVNMLLTLLQDKDPRVRAAAAEAAGQVHNEKLKEALLNALTDDNGAAQTAVAAALRQYRLTAATAVFVSTLAGRGKRISEQAVRFATTLDHDENTLQNMLENLSKVNEDNRKYLSLLLTGVLPAQETLAETVQRLNSSDPAARRQGAETVMLAVHEAKRKLSVPSAAQE